MFDMPARGTWETRGGWVTRQLSADLLLTLDQAAGVVGNLGAETSGFTALQETRPQVRGSRGGYGWAQWTGPRRRAFEAWCKNHNLYSASDEANYGFLVHELKTTFKIFTDRLRKTKDFRAACQLTHREYERPQDVLDGTYMSFPIRLAYAKRALDGAKTLDPIRSVPPPDLVEAVKEFKIVATILQKLLQHHGYYHGEIDSDFGPRSRSALLAFEKLTGEEKC